MSLQECVCVLCGTLFEARTSYGLCDQCISQDRLREFDRLESAIKAARRAGLDADLTLLQWLSTMSDWAGKCAFCDEYTASVIEQVYPGQGLTYSNVVPSCRACHSRRSEGYERGEERVRKYLFPSAEEEK